VRASAVRRRGRWGCERRRSHPGENRDPPASAAAPARGPPCKVEGAPRAGAGDHPPGRCSGGRRRAPRPAAAAGSGWRTAVLPASADRRRGRWGCERRRSHPGENRDPPASAAAPARGPPCKVEGAPRAGAGDRPPGRGAGGGRGAPRPAAAAGWGWRWAAWRRPHGESTRSVRPVHRSPAAVGAVGGVGNAQRCPSGCGQRAALSKEGVGALGASWLVPRASMPSVSRGAVHSPGWRRCDGRVAVARGSRRRGERPTTVRWAGGRGSGKSSPRPRLVPQPAVAAARAGGGRAASIHATNGALRWWNASRSTPSSASERSTV
jgi:hypothetical protein